MFFLQLAVRVEEAAATLSKEATEKLLNTPRGWRVSSRGATRSVEQHKDQNQVLRRV